MFPKSKNIAIAVLTVIFLFLWHHPDAYCKAMPEVEPPVIEEITFEDEGVTVYAPTKWVVDGAKYTIVVDKLDRKIDAEKQAENKGLRYIINLDIHAIDPKGEDITVQEITTDPDQFPPIKVEVKQLEKKLYIWDGKKWESAEKSVVKDAKVYFENIDKFMDKTTYITPLSQKRNNKLSFSVLRWPKDDRDMSDG